MAVKKYYPKKEMRKVRLTTTSAVCGNNCGAGFKMHELACADDTGQVYHVSCVSYLPPETKTVVRDLELTDNLGVKSK